MEPRFHPAHHSTNQLPSEIASPAPEMLLAVAGKSDTASEQLQQVVAGRIEKLKSEVRDMVKSEMAGGQSGDPDKSPEDKEPAAPGQSALPTPPVELKPQKQG